ncbi:MAG TPA: DUF3054 domain-containing protein [Actinomycetota bacterium]|nr:DUF3054 domain-containing protein [Actinomycetota bacterium]
MTPNARRALIATGDVVALLIFTIVGLVNHEDGVTASATLKVVLPIVVIGALPALVFGTYSHPSVSTLLPTWAISVPSGILIRKALFDTPASWGSTGVFIGVALAFTLLFLLAWRLLARFLHLGSAIGESA